MRLFVGDDWAYQHHDAEPMDTSGRRPAKARLPEGVAGTSRPHAVLGAWALAGFGDAEGRYAGAKAGKNYAGTSPITRASGNEEGRAGALRAQ